MHQVLCHEYDESPFRHDEYENPITSTGKVWHQKQRGVTRGTEKEKYITKLLRVALKKYITGVFVFKPCLFYSEGGLLFVMFLLTRVVSTPRVTAAARHPPSMLNDSFTFPASQ